MELSFADLMRYHGGSSPGGVAVAFKVLERALPLLDSHGPCEAREIEIETAFGGPGARDAFERATGAVSQGRYVVTAELERPELGRERERFVFRLTCRGRSVTLVLRDGFVVPEFIELARTAGRTDTQEEQLDRLKRELAERVMAQPAAAVFDVD